MILSFSDTDIIIPQGIRSVKMSDLHFRISSVKILGKELL